MTRIIPAIDIINGKCVRLTLGDYNQKKIYAENPLEVALDYEEKGADRLHIVDLDAAKSGGSSNNLSVIKKIIKQTNLRVQVGGGMKKTAQVKQLLDNGAAKIIVGSKAQRDRPGTIKWLEKFGPENIIIASDVRNGKIAINAWLDTSNDDITDFLFYYMQHGANQFLCTDILRDGMLLGPSIELYNSLIQKFPGIRIIGSGGVTSASDIEELIEIGVEDIIIGKAIYEGKVNIESLLAKY